MGLRVVILRFAWFGSGSGFSGRTCHSDLVRLTGCIGFLSRCKGVARNVDLFVFRWVEKSSVIIIGDNCN